MSQAELIQPVTLQAVRCPRAAVAFVAVLIAIGAGLALGGEAGRFASTGLIYAPLFVLAGLLQMGERTAARVASWVWFWLMLLGFGAAALGLAAGPVFGPGRMPEAERLIAPVLTTMAILVLGAVIAATPLWAVLGRRLGATIDQSRAAHAQGTVALLIGSALSLMPLALLGGKAPLIDVLNGLDSTGLTDAEQLMSQLYSVLWTVALVLWAVRWPGFVGIRAALARLGIGPLRKRDVLPLIGMIVLAVAVGMALDAANGAVFGWLGWPISDGSIVTRLLPVATTPLGAVIVALCAGVSEELLFRGLLQPRFGWLLANIGFAAMHAFQYGLDGLVVVFVGGALLAFVRQRWNTSASITVHVGYDMLLLLLSAFGLNP